MKLSRLYSIVLTVAVVAYVAASFVVPLFRSHAVFESGEYRDFYIGQHKRDVLLTIQNGFGQSRTKLTDIQDDTKQWVGIFYVQNIEDILASDYWMLSYPSFYNETIYLHFEESVVVRITYNRDLIFPM
jgi:hypothetical protein